MAKIKIKYDDAPKPHIDSGQKIEVTEKNLNIFLKFKEPIATVPSYAPKNFGEQIVIYENGATRRLYVYVNNSWRYCSLT